MLINGIKMKYDRSFGSYFATMKAEPFDLGKHHFIPKFRTIFVSSEMYHNTPKSFFYITSNIVGDLRLYRHHIWEHDVKIANIFASGKTLEEARINFEHNLKYLIYNCIKE